MMSSSQTYIVYNTHRKQWRHEKQSCLSAQESKLKVQGKQTEDDYAIATAFNSFFY